MITEYPAYLQKIDIDALKQFVPACETFYTLILKEIMDNAQDAAEKTDNTVYIDIDQKSGYISIKNKGSIPESVLKNLSRPDINVSEKYRQHAFKRGAIGQGLGLAIAVATLNGKDFIIKTNNKCLTINISDRLSLDPDNIFNIQEKDIDTCDTTEISFYAEKVKDMLFYYMLVNPHITFFLNGNEYKRCIDTDKCLKNDIDKYDIDDINKLLKFYSKADIINSFNVVNSRKKEILNSTEFAISLLKYAKPVKPPISGSFAIENRLKDLLGDTDAIAYKKIEIKGAGVLELFIFKNDSELSVISVNGSILNDGRLWLYDEKHNMQLPFGRLISETKFKDNLIAIYHSSCPEFTDSNKQSIVINTDESEFTKIKNFLKTFSKRTSHDSWHLCSDKDELTEKIVFISNEMYLSMNLPITIRQLYYQLVSRGVIVNGKYNTLDAYLTDLRKKGILDWQLFEDRNRYFHKINTIDPEIDIKDLVSAYIANLELPPIDKWHNQPYHVELWYEKDALSTYFQHIADKWHILCFANRGYNSFTMNKETENRFAVARNKGKNIVVLYAGDYDPHGFVIYESLKRELNVKIERIALTAEQIKQYNLIEMPELKGADKIKNDFICKYGKKAYELDALPNKELMRLLDSSIAKYFNPDLYDETQDAANLALLEKIKRSFAGSLS